MQEGLLTYTFANFEWRNKASAERGKDKKGKEKLQRKKKNGDE